MVIAEERVEEAVYALDITTGDVRIADNGKKGKEQGRKRDPMPAKWIELGKVSEMSLAEAKEKAKSTEGQKRAVISSVISSAEKMVALADSGEGAKYSQGKRNQNPDYFDCSSFVHWAYKNAGIEISVDGSYTTGYIEKWIKNNDCVVSKDDMQPGDIICYPGHVAIYKGDGYMIDASSSKGKVIERKVFDTKGNSKIKAVGRPVKTIK